MTQSNLGMKSLFGFHPHIVVHYQRNSGQGLKQGRNLERVDAEVMGASYWFAPYGFLNYLS